MSVTSMLSKVLWQPATAFIRNHKRTLIEVVSVVAFFAFMSVSISKCSYYKSANEKNIIALTDTVKYYTGKLGNEVARKTMVEADYASLKNINDSLYTLVNSMNVKKPETVVGGTVTITNLKHDTVWVTSEEELKSDSIVKSFNFSDKYRQLEGNVSCFNKSLGLSIEKDNVMFDYALAIKDGVVYMTSDNPYVKFSSITGLKVPESKKVKKFGIGPMIYAGFGSKGFNYGIGVGVQYNMLNF